MFATMSQRVLSPAVVESVGGFETGALFHGCMFDASEGQLPSRLLGFIGEAREEYGTRYSTTFGFVQSGAVELSTGTRRWSLEQGLYFSVPGMFELGGTGSAVLFERIGYRGMFAIGGPVEPRGRLSYIDGCSDSLLVYPARVGDPCMNVLHFPEGVRQTMHTHPTIRLALVISGGGRCIMPRGEVPLKAGNAFLLREMEQHCFHTDDSVMSIVTYHPDSDWGPSDANHPMINRTLIGKAS